MPLSVATIIGIVFAIIATILTAIFIMPQKRVPKLNKFLYFLHKLVNFKTLLIEIILKIMYILATCSCILVGFFMLFSWQKTWFGTTYFGLYGLLLMILGPIIVRLTYEGLMMFVILVNHTGELRKKFCDSEQGKVVAEKKKAPANFIFCSKCGTRYDANAGDCPNCSK